MGHLLENCSVSVVCAGELVEVTIGNVAFTLEFPFALDLSVALRQSARVAKANAGLTSRTFHALGILKDANAKVRKTRFSRNVAPRLSLRSIFVEPCGQLVTLRVGRSTVGLPFTSARTLSQWIRLRAKEARNNAGETAHWSKLVTILE